MQVGKIAQVNFSNDEFSRKVQNVIKKKIDVFYESSREPLQEAISNVIQNLVVASPIVAGLSGRNAGSLNGSDLQAEYGLTSDDASSVGTNINSVLDKFIKIRYRNSKTSKSTKTEIMVVLDGGYRDALSSAEWAQYMSENSEGTSWPIEWMRWIIEYNTVTFDDYSIMYASSVKKKKRSRFMAYSRSGRALMVKEEDGTYVSPRMVVPIIGKDFIQDILMSSSGRSILNKELKRTFAMLWRSKNW